MANQQSKRLAEWTLVFLSVGFTYLCIEIGYRIYLYYTYAVIAEYSVVTIDARQPRRDFNAPGNVFGPNPTNAFYNAAYYNGSNDVVYRHKVRTNNLGWTSRYDYSPAKATGEYRIAVVGGSTTAAVTNELAWTDVVQDRLSSDRELLTALGVERFSVINVGFLGAGMSTIAVPGTVIAKRFSPDLTVINFSIENVLAESGIKEFKVPADAELEVKESRAPAEPYFEFVDGAEIPLNCSQGPKSLSNPNCAVSPVWYIPPGRERSGAEIAKIKQAVARRRLLYAVLLSPRPLALLEVLGRPVIPQAHAAKSTLSQQQRAQFDSALNAFRFIHQLESHLLLTHNPHTWHAQPEVSFQIDELIAQLKGGGFDIVKMTEYLPSQVGSREVGSWYMFNGHWNDKGAEIYGNAVARVIRQRLLTERGLGPANDEAACARSFAQFKRARGALAKGDQPVAEKELDAALVGLPPQATDPGKRASTDYADCGFVVDLHLERAALFEAHGEAGPAEAHWQAALGLGDTASVYERRATLRLTRGDDQGASGDLSELIQLEPDEPRFHILRGDLRLKAQDGAGALDDFKSVSQISETDAVLRFRMSQAQWLLQDYAGVVSNTTAALGLLPRNAGLLFLRGTAKERLGQFNDALADYSAAIEEGPNATYSAARAKLLAERGLVAPGDSGACAKSLAQFHSARAALAEGHQLDAEKALDAALAGLPSLAMDGGSIDADCGFVVDLQLERSALFEGQGKRDLAEAHWQAALKLGSPVSVLERRATVRLARGDNQGANGDLAELIRLEPDEPRFHILRGDLRLKTQDAAGALDDFKSASRVGETDATLRFRMSQAQWLLQDYSGVVSNTTAGLALLPRNSGLLFLRGAAKERLGQLDDALADYSAAIELEPNATYVAARAELLRRLGR